MPEGNRKSLDIFQNVLDEDNKIENEEDDFGELECAAPVSPPLVNNMSGVAVPPRPIALFNTTSSMPIHSQFTSSASVNSPPLASSGTSAGPGQTMPSGSFFSSANSSTAQLESLKQSVAAKAAQKMAQRIKEAEELEARNKAIIAAKAAEEKAALIAERESFCAMHKATTLAEARTPGKEDLLESKLNELAGKDVDWTKALALIQGMPHPQNENTQKIIALIKELEQREQFKIL